MTMSVSKKIVKKICILGDPFVGKTSLIRKFVYDVFDDKYISTIGTKVTTKQILLDCNGKKIEITFLIWDILGQREHQSLHSAHYKGASGALVVCDITRRETLDNIKNWVDALHNVVGKTPVLILANKNDLEEKAFSSADLKKISLQYNADFFLTSAKTGENVENAFLTLGRILVKLSL
jgi:small GTP-binding protein